MDKDSLYAAAIAGDTNAISELQMYAGRLTIDDRTILHIESMDGITTRVQFILDKFSTKILLAKVDSKKETALHLAAYYGHAEVVKILINAARYSPSFPAVHSADTKFNLIGSYKAFVWHANDSMNTALHVAVGKGNLDIAKLLVDADKSHRHIQNCKGETPIYLAAKLGYTDIVKMLCHACTNPALDGPEGTPALHAAIIFMTKGAERLVADYESKELWLQYLPPERVLAFGCKDNFWAMGDTGCGGRYGKVFPELKLHEKLIMDFIAFEEKGFDRTLINGIARFKKAAKAPQRKTPNGQSMGKKRRLMVDVYGFDKAMNESGERSRNAHSKQAGRSSLEGIAAGDDVVIVLESTSFYAEQGCQIYDTGILEGPFVTFEVSNLHSFGRFIVHIGHFREDSGRFSVGDRVNYKVE
ncbi:hypothetical protein AgCh_002010 [Apium graveolens]